MVGEGQAQRGGRALIEEDSHSGRSQGAPCRMLQNGANLLRGYTGEPVHEFRDLSAILEILEQGRHGNPSAAKYPSAAYAFGVTLDEWAGRPINHHEIVPSGKREKGHWAA